MWSVVNYALGRPKDLCIKINKNKKQQNDIDFADK
jgi:hypothetical protein